MRVPVDGAALVGRVEGPRWPVRAALIAIEPVSRSRISPTMMMFGSCRRNAFNAAANVMPTSLRSEEHTSELQSLTNLVCRLLLEKKKKEKDKHRQNYII